MFVMFVSLLKGNQTQKANKGKDKSNVTVEIFFSWRYLKYYSGELIWGRQERGQQNRLKVGRNVRDLLDTQEKDEVRERGLLVSFEFCHFD